MKKWFKKAIAIVLTTTIAMTATMPAFAADSTNISSYTMSEYDMYLDMKSQTPITAQVDNETSVTAAFVQNGGIEQLLLERAQLSENELKETYGYTNEQIEILKDYDGSPLEQNPQLRAVLAEVSLSIAKGSVSTSRFTAYISWNWSACPLVILGVEDGLGVALEPLNDDQLLHLRFNQNASYCDVTYCRISGSVYQTNRYSLQTDPSAGIYNNAYSQFDSFRMVENNQITTYAKKGTMCLVTDSSSDRIDEIGYIFRYGHGTNIVLPIEVSINISVFTVTFRNASSTEQHKTVITSSGNIIKY